MSFLNLDGTSGSANIVERLVLERKRRTAKSIGFEEVDLDEAILQAAVSLFRDRQQQLNPPPLQSPHLYSYGHQPIPPPVLPTSTSSSNSKQDEPSNVKLEKLCINNCPTNSFVKYLIEAAMGIDLFREIELQGNQEEQEREVLEVQAAAAAAAAQQEAACGRDIPQPDDQDAEDSAIPPSPTDFDLESLGFRMRFSRRLRKLELINLPIFKSDAESLMYGIETTTTTGIGCRLETLVMEGVGFVHDEEEEETERMGEDEDVYEEGQEHGYAYEGIHGQEETAPTNQGDGTVVIKELCEGFPKNRTLKTIEMTRCGLTDSQIALVFDSLAHHPTLTNLNLSENSCRKLGLEALDRILVSPQFMPRSGTIEEADQGDTIQRHCKIETLDLSYQFTSEETYATGEHIQLDILTRNCTTTDADIRIYPNLRKLVLQGNQIYDSDMEELAFLIRHRFPLLEELDLRFNEITVEGLEIFANRSCPNDETYLASDKNDADSKQRVRRFKDFPLPNSRLRTIRLTNNPLVMTNQTSNVILKLLTVYPELQHIQSNLEWEKNTSVALYIQHLLDINRAGRVLLLANSSDTSAIVSNDNQPQQSHLPTSIPAAMPIPEEQRQRQLMQQQRRAIPLSAWPLVLSRLTRKARYPHYIPEKNSLNGMFYLIRHGPIIMEQMASRTSKKITSNKNKRKTAKPKEEDENGHKRKRGDPALGGYATLADFLRCELGVNA